MPFIKVPAPIHNHHGTAVKMKSTAPHANGLDVVMGGLGVAGARRIRAPLRHSVDGAPTTSGTPSTTARQNFRSSYADPAVVNGADPYVKSSAGDLSTVGYSSRPASVVAMTSSARPETTRMISHASIDSCSTDSGRPASAGSSVVRQMACQIELHSDISTTPTTPTTPPLPLPSNGHVICNRKLRDRPEEVGAASEALRDAIYRSSRAGWTRDQSAHRLWSRNDANDGVTSQLPPIVNGNGNAGEVANGAVVVGESLIAREIREQREREEELMKQRRVPNGGSHDNCDVTTSHVVDAVDGLGVAAESNGHAASRHVTSLDSVNRDVAARDVISPSIVGRRSPATLTATKTGDRASVLARYQPTPMARAGTPSDLDQRRAVPERQQDTKKARSVLLSYLPTTAPADPVKPPTTTPTICNRNATPTPNALRATSPFRLQFPQPRPPSAAENGGSSNASNANTGNRPESVHPENARNGHVILCGAGAASSGGGSAVGSSGSSSSSGVESTMRKLASSRMHIELERDRQRERDVHDEKGFYRRTPTPIGRFGGGNTPIETAKDESASAATKSAGVLTNQSSQQRTKTKQFASNTHRVAFSDEVDIVKSPICGQVLTSVRSSFIEKEINDLRNREEELRRQRESRLNAVH